ncbi:MAG TPA: hypothetical protein VHN39_07945 [Phenylobacterium sp.]|jgi:hypothetical protein|nr:hypothetical protein [Phenylobacterium sp.]
MRRTDWRRLGAVLAVAIAGLPPAQAAAAPKPGPNEATTVSELIVTATKTVSELTVTAKIKCLDPDRPGVRTERPKVVSSYPAKGAVVRPGLLIVRVTFDQPMACDGLLLRDAPRQNPCPGTPQQFLLSYDRRTVRTVCIVEPGVEYGLTLGTDPDARTFVGLAGLPSLAYRLDFITSTQPAVSTICDALAQDEDTAKQIRARRSLDCGAAPPGG